MRGMTSLRPFQRAAANISSDSPGVARVLFSNEARGPVSIAHRNPPQKAGTKDPNTPKQKHVKGKGNHDKNKKRDKNIVWTHSASVEKEKTGGKKDKQEKAGRVLRGMRYA